MKTKSEPFDAEYQVGTTHLILCYGEDRTNVQQVSFTPNNGHCEIVEYRSSMHDDLMFNIAEVLPLIFGDN